MAQAKLESTSRRDLLKGATAIAALAVPATALAAAAPDPIFVAIEQERAARKAWLASFDQDGECDARLHQTAMNAAGDALRTCPTTVAGVIAAMEWTAEAEADYIVPDDWHEDFIPAMAAALKRIAASAYPG